jgi:hypothetical protein
MWGFFLASFINPGVLKKELTVWLDPTRPANTCIPPSYPVIMLCRYAAYPLQKNMCGSIYKITDWFIRMIHSVKTMILRDGELAN